MYCIPTMNEQYDIMFAKFKTGQITEQQWREFCNTLMDQILVQNTDVFVRLKFR